MKYKLQKEGIGNRIQEDSRLDIEAKSIKEVKVYLNKNKLEFIRYSEYSETVYYK